jgi:hypothetical protein
VHDDGSHIAACTSVPGTSPATSTRAADPGRNAPVGVTATSGRRGTGPPNTVTITADRSPLLILTTQDPSGAQRSSSRTWYWNVARPSSAATIGNRFQQRSPTASAHCSTTPRSPASKPSTRTTSTSPAASSSTLA